MRPLFSVVIVTYFHEKYIEQALQSVLNQNGIENAEILIGDDGSTDDTIKILRKYEEKYPNIQVFTHDNWGLSKNLFQLLSVSKGQYIAILEGDDYWVDNNKLVFQQKIIDSNRCIGTACNSIKIDEHNNQLGLWNTKTHTGIVSERDILFYQTSICHPSGIMMKNIFIDNVDKYDVIANASRMGGNHTGMINLLCSEGGLYFDERAMAVWRYVNSSDSHNYSSQMLNKPLDYYESLQKYEKYDEKFNMNFERHIYMEYLLLLRSLKREIIGCIGRYRFIMAKIELVFYCIRKIFIKVTEKLSL